MTKLEILHTDQTRYSEHEIDIHCRISNCGGSLGHIIHICSKRLTTVCGNCGQVQEIQTNIMPRKRNYF